MITNVLGLNALIAAKGFVLNSYLQLPGAFSAEVYAAQGWDAITLDYQHGLIGYHDAVAILQAIARTGVLPLVRVPGLESGTIMKLLDAGALGITCAMINTAADAERLVRICKYPPRGERSFGPVRAALVHGEDYARRADALVAVLAMVETAEAVANIDAILDVDGIDGIYLGPADLAQSMGRPVGIGDLDPAVAAAIERVRSACVAHGKVVGMIAPDPARASQLVERGFRLETAHVRHAALAGQAQAWVDRFKRAQRRGSAPPTPR
jgi:4-hydroxy-2-oxoheptanedioate aldolase